MAPLLCGNTHLSMTMELFRRYRAGREYMTAIARNSNNALSLDAGGKAG